MAFMQEEIRQQPAIVADLSRRREPFAVAVREARDAGVRFVLYAARGTSDNAAVYGKYLATIRAGLPAGLAIPSAATVYDAPIHFRECLVIGISQSGETPDVAEYLAHAREAGAFTIAVTNDEHSLLAREAQAVLATRVGAERAVAATKTYTSQLAALALFWATWTRDDALIEQMQERVPTAMAEALDLEPQVAEAATWLRFTERLVVAARGYNFATALETALKLKETTYIAAMPYSSADFLHGPIAMVEQGFPVLLFTLPGKTGPAMRDLEAELLRRGAELIVVEADDTAKPVGGAQAARADGAKASASGATARGGAQANAGRTQVRRAGGPARAARRRVLTVPGGLDEALTPLVAALPGQMLAYHLAVARGYDPDRPRGLSKVTRTF